ncbi:hypothetical protein 12Stean4476_00038 [Erwinia phage Stean]|nr:hypothetical protein 12Stean4476_00038 [Erwinia phage Stean]
MWGVLCFLVASGAIAGATITNYVVQSDANKQIASVKEAYAEAGKNRLDALNMCLRQTSGAADKAASAATDAAAKAEAAAQSADKAAAAVSASSDIPQ